LSGQTINIMTLGGWHWPSAFLSMKLLSQIENIHAHPARGETLSKAVLIATKETITHDCWRCFRSPAVPARPSSMIRVTRSLFIPLALAIGFGAMLASYVLYEHAGSGTVRLAAEGPRACS
jgi:hypothetical protein